MRSPRGRVLIVEDAPALAETYVEYLKTENCTAEIVGNGRLALAAISTLPPDVLVLDVNLPDINGIDVLREVRSRGLPTEVVVITGQASVHLAVESMKEGALDFLTKPFTADRLRVTVRNALERRKLESQVAAIQEEVGRDRFCGFIGQSMVMQSIYRILQNAAASKATVFVTGESGTGKELCADALHKLSRRSEKPFVAINCAAIPRDLLESEVFGHAKGAFTGATSDRAGAALQANGGTLFLDEICEMDLGLQAKMLRFLQTGTVQRVGEDKPRAVDVRIVCATNRDPQAEVAAGRFREDLFYRLNVIPVDLPALRERDDDIVLIARHFLHQYAGEDHKRFARFAADVEAALMAYAWPGNVRELQNVVRNIVVLNDGESVDLAMLPRPLQTDGGSAVRSPGLALRASPGTVPGSTDIEPLDLVVRRTIEQAIARSDGNVPKAAAALQVSPSTLYRRLQAWQADPEIK
ncbi:MAG: sigma-54-dependent Fis family transcriptional regulator [Rhodospirillales bacterium]|nr:sigma-54-dependent Fis family transcriptional regulator [Rhodospirillales bacterium]